MFNIISILFKYIFIIIIYLFIFSIIRLIYLDIKGINLSNHNEKAYIKLVNRIDSLPYKLNEHYNIDRELKLGRSKGNNIIIKDPFISKEHFVIVEDESDYYIEDLNSSNGTYINGEQILDVVRLDNNDRIRVGNIEFLFVNIR